MTPTAPSLADQRKPFAVGRVPLLGGAVRRSRYNFSQDFSKVNAGRREAALTIIE